jgi:hypothetical protein
VLGIEVLVLVLVLGDVAGEHRAASAATAAIAAELVTIARET